MSTITVLFLVTVAVAVISGALAALLAVAGAVNALRRRRQVRRRVSDLAKVSVLARGVH